MQRLMWKFLNGYVTITVEGLYLERFLDDVRKIYRIRQVKRLRYTAVSLTARARYTQKIIAEAEKRSLRCTIVHYSPLARFTAELYRRWWIPVCAVLITSAAIWASGYCFRIDFIGNERLSEFALYTLLEQNGISTGMRKRDIDLLKLKNLLYHEYRFLSFAEARFDGTTLSIILEEGGEVPELMADSPCSVAAEKRGVILSVTVGEGMANAQPGDIVEAGDILIAGAYRKKERDFLVHAGGRVIAQVDYIGRAELSAATGLVRTGKSASARFLEIGRMKIPLRGNNPFSVYESESAVEYTIPENMPTFLRITETTYYECERGISDEARTAAEAQLRERAYYDALQQVPEDAEILDFYSVISQHRGKLSAVATVTVKEDIGKAIPASLDEIENTKDTGDI